MARQKPKPREHAPKEKKGRLCHISKVAYWKAQGYKEVKDYKPSGYAAMQNDVVYMEKSA